MRCCDDVDALRDERCQSGDGGAAMRIVGTIAVTAGSCSVHEVSDISRDEIGFSGDENVLGGTSVSDATSRAQLSNVMFRLSWRDIAADVVVDTQLGCWPWVLAFLIGA